MKRFFTTILALLFPWVILLLNDNPGGALVALIMQGTLIGWPFATVWALRVSKENRIASKQPPNKHKQA